MQLKLLFFFLCFSINFYFTSNAQIKKGSIFLGGNISFSSVKYNIELPQELTQKQRSISIQPLAGKAIRDNTIMGIYISFSYAQSDNINNSLASKTNQYAGALFLRKYKSLLAGFSLFGETDLHFLHEGRTYYRSNETDNTKGPTIGISFYPGLSYAVNKKLQLETAFGQLFDISYTHEKRLVKGSDGRTNAKSTMNFFNVQTSLNNISTFRLGFRLLISK